jgi:hypothetical protein
LVKRIVKNKKIKKTKENDREYNNVFPGTKNVPYNSEEHGVKILVATEDKKRQVQILENLKNADISTVKLTRANVAKFEREKTQVCVAGNLFGVNMGFLTHIIVDEFTLSPESVVQIVGRGQRLSRKQNLQVYLLFNETDEGEEGEEEEI